MPVWAVLTWPWVTRIWSHAPGNDAASFIWAFSWIRRSLLAGRWPLHTDAIFAPGGVSLASHTDMPLLAVASVPLQALVGPARAFNLVVLGVVLLAAAATALLARDLGATRPVAAVSGLLLIAVPAVVDRYGFLEHPNLATVFWIPTIVLLWRRLERSPGTARAVAFGGALAGAAWTDLTIATLAGLATAAYLVASLRGGPSRGRLGLLAPRLAISGGVAALLLAPLAVALAVDIAGGEIEASFDAGAAQIADKYATDAVGLFVGDDRAAIAGVPGLAAPLDDVRDAIGRRQDGAGDLGVGLTLLAAVGTVAALRARRRGSPDDLARHAPWLLGLGVTATLLSLGPTLRVLGRTFAPLRVEVIGLEGSALLPYTWMRLVPVLSGLRAPNRLTLLAALPLAMLAAVGVRALWRRGGAGRAALAAALALVALEAPSTHDDLVPARAPAIYDSVTAAAQPGDIVVDVPLGFRTGFLTIGRWSDGATAAAADHGLPIATGFVSRLAEERFEELYGRPLYTDLMRLQEAGVDAGDVDAAREMVERHDIRHVVVDLAGLVPARPGGIDDYLRRIGFVLIEERDGYRYYRSPR